MITDNPLSPEIKQQIDIIKNNPNTSPETKQEQFGLFMRGLTEKFSSIGQSGLDKLDQLKAKGKNFASEMDDYLGIQPKPDPRSMPQIPTERRTPFQSPDPTVVKPRPNAPWGQKIERSPTPFVPLLERLETAAKTANPIDPRTLGGSMNAVNPLPPVQNREAIRARYPGVQGEVASGGFPAQGMQSGRGPTQIPRGGIPGNEYRDPSTFLQQPQAQPNIFPSVLNNRIGSGVGGAVDAHRQQQQQMQQAQQQEMMKQQQMDKNGRFGMSGFFDKLFNDPSRMAMLQGGLTMMDPSSYYDREGFSSPWTGMRSGMGAAGRGYQGVKKRQMDERESASKVAFQGASTLKNMNDLQIDDVLTRTKYSSVVGNNYVDKYQIALDIKGGMSQEKAFEKNSYQFGSSAYDKKTADLNKKTDASIAQINQLLDDPNSINWNTVGIPGGIKELFETGASWTGMETEMEAGKLRLTADWIQSMAWRDLVGSGQLSIADYERLQNMLGTRGITDTPQKVRLKFQKAMKFLKDTRVGAGTHLRRNTNQDGTGKLPSSGAPDLSILDNDDVWSPEDQADSEGYF
jgi:hypothetical protein